MQHTLRETGERGLECEGEGGRGRSRGKRGAQEGREEKKRGSGSYVRGRNSVIPVDLPELEMSIL